MRSATGRSVAGPAREAGRDYRQAEADSMPELLAQLAENSAALIRDEIDLARQELKESARKLMSGIIAVTAGATVASIALLVLVAAAVIGLGNLIGYGLSALVIGAFLGVIGGSMTLLAIRRIRRTRLRPERTIETLQEDKAWLKQLG